MSEKSPEGQRWERKVSQGIHERREGLGNQSKSTVSIILLSDKVLDVPTDVRPVKDGKTRVENGRGGNTWDETEEPKTTRNSSKYSSVES